MAVLPTTHTNNFTIPKGKVYVRETGNDPLRYLGANQVATLTREVEKIEIVSAEGGLGVVLDEQNTNVKYMLALTLADMSLANLKLFVNGVLYTVTQASGSVTDELKTITKNTLCILGESLATPTGARKVSALTIKHYAGDNASAWAGTTAYLLNDYVIPTVANSHFYKVTVAGTSGASEPTWTTNGTTVTDGTVTFKDMGLIDLVLNTDYEVNLDLGHVFIKNTSVNVEDGGEYSFNYTKAGATWEQVQSASEQTYYEVLTVADNPVGNNRDYLFPRCTFSATGDLTLKNEESAYQQFQIEVSVLYPNDGRAQVYIDGRPV